MKLATAVRRAIKALPKEVAEVRDQGACELAVTYAQAIDDGADLQHFGPLLLIALDALLLTPKARATLAKEIRRGPAESPLDELRAQRAARQRDTATVDPATPTPDA